MTSEERVTSLFANKSVYQILNMSRKIFTPLPLFYIVGLHEGNQGSLGLLLKETFSVHKDASSTGVEVSVRTGGYRTCRFQFLRT